MSPAPRRASDPRTPAERASDAAMGGTVYRCPTHGATQDPIVLGGLPYCPSEDCTAVCRVAVNLARKGCDPGFSFRERINGAAR